MNKGFEDLRDLICVDMNGTSLIVLLRMLWSQVASISNLDTLKGWKRL